MTKEEYISAQTETYQSKYKTLFQWAEKYEQKNGTDLGEFTTEQFEEFIISEFDLRTIRRVYDIQMLIRKYIADCGYDATEINRLDAKEVFDRKNEDMLFYPLPARRLPPLRWGEDVTRILMNY